MRERQSKCHSGKPDIQGEGDYKSGKVDEAAKKAPPRSEQEARQMEEAECEGNSHSKGEAPAVMHPKNSRQPDQQPR